MDKREAIKIIYRIEEDTNLLGRIIARTAEAKEVLDGETKRALQDSILRSIANLEAMDSYLGTFMRMRGDNYISIDRIVSSTAKKIIKNDLSENVETKLTIKDVIGK